MTDTNTTFLTEISSRVAQTLRAIFGHDAIAMDPSVRRAQDESFGDYQSNCAMALAKILGKNPKNVAHSIIDSLRIDDLCEMPTIAGPGFINFRLRPTAVAERLGRIPKTESSETDRLGIPTSAQPRTVVVDFSSPNLAKEMHVGHLRSTVIGDCVSRLLEFAGHTVHRVNHVGDWGTQFGMLLAWLRRINPRVLDHPEQLQIDDLESFYVAAKNAFDGDPAFADEARGTVVALQKGDPSTLQIWKAFCTESLRHCHDIYKRLGVRLVDRGESFYNDRLAGIVEELQQRGLAVESNGAICLFLEGFKTREGEPLPMIIRKSDGGYNYDATDLAAFRHRVAELGATHLIYVVGHPQKQHFEMLFAAVRKAGWADDSVRTDHLAFGVVLGKDNRPFKTREGGTVKLKTLLDGAAGRALEVLVARGSDRLELDGVQTLSFGGDRRFTKEQIDHIAETVGIAAVKYFDLSHNLSSDYGFDLDRMCSLDGNTAPYMLYAYARIRSIARKADVDYSTLPLDTPILLDHPAELRLAKALCRFGELFEQTVRDLRPNLLTDYLYELSKVFSQFYDRVQGVRVIDASPDSVRISRLRLCDLTARTLRRGLDLLGIGVLEEM